MVVWTAFTPSFRRSIFGPEKVEKIRHVNTDLPSIALLGSSTNVKIFYLGLNEGDLPTGQCVVGIIGFDLSAPPCVGVK